MLAAVLAQAGVGYVQYFNSDPVGLVALHVAGASILVITTIRFHAGLWRDAQVTAPDHGADAHPQAAHPFTDPALAPTT